MVVDHKPVNKNKITIIKRQRFLLCNALTISESGIVTPGHLMDSNKRTDHQREDRIHTLTTLKGVNGVILALRVATILMITTHYHYYFSTPFKNKSLTNTEQQPDFQHMGQAVLPFIIPS